MLLFSLALAGIAGARVLAWNHQTYDMGELSRSAPAAHAFPFRNRTGAPVTITEVRAPCGCLSTWRDADTVLPDSAGVVRVEYLASASEGPFRAATIVVTTAGTDTLVLTGTVARRIRIDPPALDLRKVFRGDTVSAAARILWEREEPPAFSRVDFGTHVARAAIDSLKPRSFVLTVHVAPGAKTGRFEDTITIETGSALWPYVRVPLAGEVIGYLSASPSYLDLGTLDRGTTNWGTVMLVSRRKSNYNVTSLLARPEWFHAELRPGGNRFSTLAVSVAPGAPSGRLEGSVDIFVDSAAAPELTVPVRGFIR